MRGIRLGNLFGIPIALDISWFLIFALIAYTIASGYESAYPELGGAYRWGLALGTTALFFVSLLLHEIAHSIVAKAAGIPVHGITLFLFGGVSRIAREAERPGTEFVMAIMGPVMSALLGFLFWGLAWLLDGRGQSYLSEASTYLMFINFSLAVFNMLPGFPLDGGRVLRAVVWRLSGSYAMANNVATRAGQVVAGLLIAGGVAFIFWPDGSTIQGVWMIFIGWYLFSAVSTMRGQLQVKGHLTGFKVKDAMARTCPMVPHSLTLDNLVEGYIMPTGCRVFLVSSFSEPRGIVTTTQVRLVPRDRWREVRVENVMVPLDRIPSVAAQEDAYRVLEKMAEADVTELPVVEEGKVIGLVSREDLLRVASTRSELGR